MIHPLRFLVPAICISLASAQTDAPATALPDGPRPESTWGTSEAPAARPVSWFAANKHWLIAGGGLVAGGAVLWSVLASAGESGAAPPEDLGVPPGVPVAGDAK